MTNPRSATDRQLSFFPPAVAGDMHEFLAKWVELEEEEDRLREAKRTLKEDYAESFSMRALTTAVKVCRAQWKLHYHEKEPVSRHHQTQYEDLVNTFLEQRKAEQEAVQAEATRLARTGSSTTPPAGD